jgi:hypothetical protein
MLRNDQGTGNERFSTLPQAAIEVGGINGPRLKAELSRAGVLYSDWAGDLLDRLSQPEGQQQLQVVKFQLRYVGMRDYVSGSSGWDKIVKAVQREGLALVPQLTAPEMALQGGSLIESGEYVDFLSKPIAGRDGHQGVFALYRHCGGLELGGFWDDDAWDPDGLVVARLR